MLSKPILSILILMRCVTSWAWGHAAHLDSDWGQGSLAYAIHENKAVYFCVQSNDKKNFPLEDLALQTREALRTWIVAAKLNYPITIEKVNCSDSRLNLLVKIGPEKTYKDLSAYEQPQVSEGGFYSLIQLNTSYRYKANKKKYKITNTLKFKPKKLSATKWLRSLTESKITTAMTSEEWEVDYETAYFTTYKILLHEVGHAFGLCDEQDGVAEDCDPNFSGSSLLDAIRGDKSVMDTAESYFVSEDDKNGIQKLFSRFEK